MKNVLIKKTMVGFLFSLVFAMVGMILGFYFIPPIYSFACMILALIVLLVAVFVKKLITSMKTVYFITFLIGVSIYPAIQHYTSEIGATMVLVAVGITTVLFATLTLYSYFSKRDFSFLGSILFIGLLALVLVSIVGLFIESETLHLILAWVGVVIFSGYVLHDVSLIKNNDDEEMVPVLVLGMFLNFINLLLDILRIVSSIVSRD